jgi:hypothetical protein
MGYSGINIQSCSDNVVSTSDDITYLRNIGIQNLAIQIKPTKRQEYSSNPITWQQALLEELDWALDIVQACNDSELRKIKAIIRFNDLVSSDVLNMEINTKDWWDNYTLISLGFWDQVCQKFQGQEIFMFEILSEPAYKLTNSSPAIAPPKPLIEPFYQDALNIMRNYNNEAYFLLSPGPFGRFVQYLNGFTPYKIIDSIRPNKFMYGFHMYVEHDYTHQGVSLNNPRPYYYPSQNYNIIKMNQDFDNIAAWSYQYNYPIYVGEFNATRWSPNAINWVRDVILNIKQVDFHWSFFAYRPYWDKWDPLCDVKNPNDPPAIWDVNYVGYSTPLWKFLLLQF